MATHSEVVSQAVGENKLYAFIILGIGAALAYSAITGKKFLSILQGTIRGQSPATVTPTAQISGTPAAAFTNNLTPAQNQNIINQSTGNTGANNAGAAANQATAKILAAPYGWSSGSEWDALVKLWNQESGWSNTAENASGAYGIAQALPNTKYPKAGQPPSEGGSADPTTQIAWGLSYIQGRYGDPLGAWAHEVANNWY